MAGPMFRADHVGSLLRPDTVKEARRRPSSVTLGTRGYAASAELGRIEDDAIRDVVKAQESIGLQAVTDGEFRRSFWHFDFLCALEGLVLEEREEGSGVQFSGVKMRPIFPVIVGALDFPDDHPMLEHFAFLDATTNVTPKISIPGPSSVHFRTAPDDIVHSAYQDLEVLFDDIAKTYNKAVHRFYEAGCRYLQMDDIFFAYLCDEKQREAKRSEGLDPDWLIEQYAAMMHSAIADRPDDMTIAMHLCRGNFQSTWVAEGGYDPAADAVFNQTGVDIFFMEYDTDRAGGLEPLRLLPKGSQRVMPGFVTTKVGELEPLDDLLRLLEEAQTYVDLDQLGIAPQCGFASTEEGNAITADAQKRKLERVVEVAEAVWGGVA